MLEVSPQIDPLGDLTWILYEHGRFHQPLLVLRDGDLKFLNEQADKHRETLRSRCQAVQDISEEA